MGGNGKTQIVIRNGMLIDGSGDEPAQNDAIVIEGDRIRSVGPLPPDVNLEDTDKYQVIDASGRVVMPGLIDAHCHLSLRQPDLPEATWPISPEFCALWSARNAQKVLRAGVTSVSVPGGRWYADVSVRDAINVGVIEGPRIFCASRLVSTAGGISDRYPPWAATPDDNTGTIASNIPALVAEVRRQCKNGVNLIKLGDSTLGDYQVLTVEELSSVVQEAHRRGVRVTIHSRGAGSTRASAEAGVDWIMHADRATESDLEAVAEAGVRIVPALTALFYSMEYGAEVGMSQRALDGRKRSVESDVRNMEYARKIGVKVLAGSDCGNSPLVVHGDCNLYEAEVLTRHVGYTPMETIVAYTRDNAYTVGLEGEVGVIGAGKLADVLVLDGDPLADITLLQDPSRITTLIKDGKVVDRNAPLPELNLGSFELPGKRPSGNL